ncbi:MAG: Protein TolB [Anaerolineae bacterium]|nr:Protein TolB [Anaerolineae bacterium]
MHDAIKLTEKYEHQGWPSLDRPDVKPPDGWSLSLITGVSRVRHHRLSPTGERIAFIWDRDNQSDVYVMPAAGGWPARVSTERKASAYWADEVPQWSPDGQWLAFTMNGHVVVVAVAGGLPQKITDFTTAASNPVWLPDSLGLVTSVERHQTSQLLLTDRRGAWPVPLTCGPGDHIDARPSPDGQFIAFVFRPHNDLNRLDIQLVDLANGQTIPLTGAAKIKDWSPRWSPDGQTLAFLSERSGWAEVWLIGRDGQNLRQLTHLGLDVADIAWSPDGARLACTLNHGGAFELALLDARSGAATTLRGGLGFHSRPCWSPDGNFITVEYEDPGQPPDLYRVAVPGGAVTQLTFSNPPALAAHKLVVPERVSYKSFDGLEIPAFLYRPAKPNGAAILYPHGGPTSQYVFEWDILAQYLVAKGYTYLCPNFRGSTGYGLEFEHANYNDWGGGDTQDNLFGARFLRELNWIDPERLAIAGGSYGGFMTACCLSLDPDYLFACGVAKYGDANLVSSWAQCNRDIRQYTEMQLGHPARNRAVYRAGSPIFHVDNVRAPVLVLHGLDDDVVPPEASEEWVTALRRAGKTFEYKTYPGEPHGFLQRHNQLDVWRRMERFFDWYLLP